MRVMVCIEMEVDANTTKRSEIKAAVKRELVRYARHVKAGPEDTAPDAKEFLLNAVDNDKFIVRAPEK